MLRMILRKVMTIVRSVPDVAAVAVARPSYRAARFAVDLLE